MAEATPKTTESIQSSNGKIVITTPAVTNTNSSSHNIIAFVVAQFPVKLTSDNYTMWSRQFTSLLRVYRLTDFLQGTRPCPPEDDLPDSPYDLWVRQDQSIQYAILTSVSESIHPYVSSAETSHEAWVILERLYANSSRTRVNALKERLQNLRCEGRAVAEYLRIAKNLIDRIGNAEKVPLSNSDIQVYLLNGLGHEYKEFKASIRARDGPPLSFEDLQDRLLAHEESLQREEALVNDNNTPITAQFASVHPRIVGNHNSYGGFSDRNLVELKNHAHVANFATTSTSKKGDWCIDSGASDHVTPDLANLALHSEYDRPDELLIGDGSGLTISHVGHTTLPTNTKPLTLKNVLCVPHAPCNLISVSKLCRNNNVLIEFHSEYFLVKDRTMGVTLLRGPNQHGVEHDFLFHKPPPLATGTTVPQARPQVATPSVSSSEINQVCSLNSFSSSHSAHALTSSPILLPAHHCTTPPVPHCSPLRSSAQSSPPTKADTNSMSHQPTSTLPSSPATSSQLMPTNATSLSPSSNATTDSSLTPQPPPVPSRTHGMITRSQNNIFKPKTLFTMTKHPIDPPLEPTCVSQALKHHHRHQAMSDEFNALVRQGTWELVPPSNHQNVIGCKWVFRIKRNNEGRVERYKAHHVAKGFHQRPGSDYFHTFSPVIKPITIKIVLSLALNQNWPIRQLDVNNAFLHGKLEEELFMAQPPAFVDASLPQHVCRLRKSIYGLKQAPRTWFKELRMFLLSHGFQNSRSDTSLFIYHRGSDCLYFLVYVDDIIVTCSNPKLVDSLIKLMGNTFSIKDFGALNYFLGVNAIFTPAGLFLSQAQFIRDLLDKFGMAEAKPVSSPMATTALQLHQGFVFHGLLLRRQPLSPLHAFSDSDWAGDKDTLQSTTGFIVFLGSTPISWKACKQKVVARSSTEAEYRALAATSSKVIWVCNILRELGHLVSSPPAIYCDNIGATHLSSNPVMRTRMKHIAIDLHFVRELVD
ncbi:hypothetical protein SLEP1_g23864 [Rubroshorea leprosula]|uniref:Reverse transcriptase Ty1/copia-type domain-containing protein n=1 Tax=Rubroshorea leprosula TaxID=152421 RepID=A0AAV5JPP9_9ROSI|nr:hypothetical protein SLEP1_g23864 [Rubroshorea leprosula]